MQRFVPLAIASLLALCGCQTTRPGEERVIPQPTIPSSPAASHYANARKATQQTLMLDLCPTERANRIRTYALPYLRDAVANDPLVPPVISTKLGDLTLLCEGPASDEALQAYALSIANYGNWWPPGWLGVARCKAARGDLAGAEEALRQAEASVINLERRVAQGADLPQQRNFLEVVGILPTKLPPPTGNDQTLEIYWSMLHEVGAWERTDVAPAAASGRQIVARWKAESILVRSEIRGEGPGHQGPSAEALDLALAIDPTFTDARLRKAALCYSSGDLRTAWALVSPFATASSGGDAFAATCRDVRVLRLAANTTRRLAAESGDQDLHGQQPAELAESLFAQIAILNPQHGRAAAERAENLIALVERKPALQAEFVPFARTYLTQAAEARESCCDPAQVADLERRLARLAPQGSGGTR